MRFARLLHYFRLITSPSSFFLFSFFVFKDVFVNAKSMGSFVSTAGSTLEEHMWPASLTFG